MPAAQSWELHFCPELKAVPVQATYCSFLLLLIGHWRFLNTIGIRPGNTYTLAGRVQFVYICSMGYDCDGKAWRCGFLRLSR